MCACACVRARVCVCVVYRSWTSLDPTCTRPQRWCAGTLNSSLVLFRMLGALARINVYHYLFTLSLATENDSVGFVVGMDFSVQVGDCIIRRPHAWSRPTKQQASKIRLLSLLCSLIHRSCCLKAGKIFVTKVGCLPNFGAWWRIPIGYQVVARISWTV